MKNDGMEVSQSLMLSGIADSLSIQTYLYDPIPMVSTSLRLARAHLEQRDLDTAWNIYQKVYSVVPKNIHCLAGIGAIELLRGNFDRAIEIYEGLLALRPKCATTYYNLGSAFYGRGDLERAESSFRLASEFKDFALADVGLATILLLKEDYARGWPLYERRFNIRGLSEQVPHNIPRWNGQELCGKRILLWAEQGLGDTVQFLRYIRVVKAMGAYVILRVPQRLLRLVSTVHGIDEIVSADSLLLPVDFHCPLMSLAMLCGTFCDEAQNFPYLSPHAGDRQLARMITARPGFKVGLAWWGEPMNTRNLHRSIPLELFAPLGRVPNISLISLQRGAGSDQVVANIEALPLFDIESSCHDFADTARIIASLDLIITIDTSIAHVAGALGKNVWILVPYIPSWQWLLSRADSPWYPTARIFRQPDPGNWRPVINQIFEALLVFCAVNGSQTE